MGYPTMGKESTQKRWIVSITHRQQDIQKDSTYIRYRSSSRGGAGEQHGGGIVIIEIHGYVVVGLFVSNIQNAAKSVSDGVFIASMMMIVV